jgi:hypothetical protein
MASTLTAEQLADLVAKAKVILRIEDDDAILRADAFAIYHDESATATAATVAKTGDNVITVVTGGANAGTYTYDTTATANDTLTELVAVINTAAKGFVCTLLGNGDADSSLIYRKSATSCFGQANEVILEYENEELLEILIQGVLAGIETGLNRNLLSASYSEVYERPPDNNLVLLQPTVTSISMVADTFEDGLTVTYTGSDTHATVEVQDDKVVLRSRLGGTTTTSEVDFADQSDASDFAVSTADMATTIDGYAGWTAAVKQSRPSGYLRRAGAMDAKNTVQTLEVWDDTDAAYMTYYDEGIIEFTEATWSTARRFRVEYTAGYATLPKDVELVLLQSIKAAWDIGTKDAAVKKERLGDYAYELSDTFQAGGETITTAAGMGVSKLFTKYARVLP